jgi:hypothetical protein
MARTESINDALFRPIATAQARQVCGGTIPPAQATYERYADYGSNGEFLGWAYVQVD